MYIRGERTTNKCCSTLNFSELLYQLLYILCPCFLLHEIFKINWSHGVKILLYNKNKATPCTLRYPCNHIKQIIGHPLLKKLLYYLYV